MRTHPFHTLVPLFFVAAMIPASAQTSCLAKFQGKPAELLTVERVAKAADFGGKETKTDTQADSNPKYTSASVSWPSGRVSVTDLGFTKIETPQDNIISLSGPAVVDKENDFAANGREYIEKNYRSVSPEEMAAMQERMKASLEERVAKGELTREQADLAGGVGGAVAGKERVVESIDGLGDAARWVGNDRALVVAHRDVWFRLSVNVSDDAAVNRETAIAVAKVLLAVCD